MGTYKLVSREPTQEMAEVAAKAWHACLIERSPIPAWRPMHDAAPDVEAGRVLFRCCGRDDVVGQIVAIPGGGHRLACEHCGSTLDALTARADAGRVDAICREVAELPDRTSPADWPDAMLVTHDELAGILRRHLEVAAGRVDVTVGMGSIAQLARGNAVELEQATLYASDDLIRDMPDMLDHPICRLQVGPDGHVPGNTVEALEAWHKEARRLAGLVADDDPECTRATLDAICREASEHGKKFTCATCGGARTLDGERNCPSCDGSGSEHDPAEVIQKQAARIAELERRIERALKVTGTPGAKVVAMRAILRGEQP